MMERQIEVFHTGNLIIEHPDVHYGRTNADFGQGFYVTPDAEFASRWAKWKKDETTIVNHYTLDLEGLKIQRFTRSSDWFHYIFQTRRSYEDDLDADVVVGPIANDTIFDTLGIFTSGFLSDELALELLQVGPEYIQIALKTKKAAEHLTWSESTELTEQEIRSNQEILEREEAEYLTKIAEKM